MDPRAELPFDLTSLDTFLAVCDSGGMSAAARRLSMTQPAVSQTIAEMERRAGVVLFDRTVRPIGLTAIGALLRQRATTLLADAREIGGALRTSGHGRLPLLRVGLVDSLNRAVIGPLSAHLAAVAEESAVLSGMTLAHVSSLQARQLDLFLGSAEFGEAPGLEREDLERWRLIEEPYVLAMPEGEPIPRDRAELMALAARLPLARYSLRSSTGLEIERHLRRLKLAIPRRQEFDGPAGVTIAVASGRAFAITTPLCLYESGGLDGLTVAPFPVTGLRRLLVLVAHARELGRLPRQTTELVRTTLEQGFMQQARALWPEVSEAIRLPPLGPAPRL